jgi:predicted nucleic acid-binding protein
VISLSRAPFLIDTDVLVDFLRGRDEAVAFLESADAHLLVSVITVAELFAGCRNDVEGERLETFLGAFEIVPVDADIAAAGGRHRATYGPAHGTGLADALIAATSRAAAAKLVTRNRRHFPMVDDVLVPY